MACYLAVEAICGVPNDVKIVEPDLNYEIEELQIPKAGADREMSPGSWNQIWKGLIIFKMKHQSWPQNKIPFQIAAILLTMPVLHPHHDQIKRQNAPNLKHKRRSQPNLKKSAEPVYQEPPKEEKKPARQPPAPPQKSINAAVDIWCYFHSIIMIWHK